MQEYKTWIRKEGCGSSPFLGVAAFLTLWDLSSHKTHHAEHVVPYYSSQVSVLRCCE